MFLNNMKSSSSSITFILCLYSLLGLSCTKNNIERYNHVYGIPDYYFENGYLDNKVKEIKEAIDYENGVSFGFLTDIHVSRHLLSEDNGSTSGNAGHSPYILKYFVDSLKIPFVLFGGDVPVVRAKSWDEIIGSADKWKEMMNVIGKEKVFQTRGNHDYLGYASFDAKSVTRCTPQELYPIIMNGEKVYDVVAPEGKMYYYFDVRESNLRVVVLDDYGDGDKVDGICGTSCIGQIQYDWLINEALACDNKHIILLSHQTADPFLDIGRTDVDKNRKVLHEILKAFTNKTLLNYTSSDINGTVNVHKDFSLDTNTLICHLSGHRHIDQSKISDGVLSITHACDCYSGYRAQGNYEGRSYGTITEHAVSVFSIDFDSRIIKMTRIGAGVNKEFVY